MERKDVEKLGLTYTRVGQQDVTATVENRLVICDVC